MSGRPGFVDECGLHVKGGDGGAGAVSFRREAHVSRGGPDGGNGGDGGSVWLVADRNVASLLAYRDHPFRRAKDGKHGQGKKRHGARGEDMFAAVPPGTTVRDQDGELLADLVGEGDRFMAAEGGRGGRGNAAFLSNRRRAPAFAEQGEEGEERWLRMELKLLADVALVGFPNVGKSTLIARVSAAKPKIADYPFTTLEPNLGVVRTDDQTEFVVADVPGLIEGASEGRGLGHQFLRHVERARVLAVLVDLSPFAELDPATQERILLDELASYRSELLDRPRLLLASRVDLAGDQGSATPASADRQMIRVSAVTGEGVAEAVGAMATAVARARAEEPERESFVVHRLEGEGYRIDRADDGSFVVVGRQAERAVGFSDLTDADAMEEAHRRLQAMGINRALARSGARPGDAVRIGDVVFDYEEDP